MLTITAIWLTASAAFTVVYIFATRKIVSQEDLEEMYMRTYRDKNGNLASIDEFEQKISQ